MPCAGCVILTKVHQWGSRLFDLLTTQDISMLNRSLWTKLRSRFHTLLVFIRSGASSGNMLCTMSIGFGRLMNCISWSWVQVKTYCTGRSNTWKPVLSRIIVTIDSHQYHDIWAFRASLNNAFYWNTAPGVVKWSGAWSERWQWIAIHFMTTPKNDGKTMVETASDEMVMGAARAWYEFTLLVRQQTESDLSLTALGNTLKQFYKNKGTYREQKMSKSANSKVVDNSQENPFG